MKPFFAFVILFFLFSACGNQSDSKRLPGSIINNPASMGKEPEGNYPIISFDTAQFDFGRIIEGDVVSHTFNFKNTGTANLVITDVRASCGCTSPVWPKEIIKVGESNSIVIKYDSEGREGKFSKGITVYCNAYPNSTLLRIQGEVIPKL